MCLRPGATRLRRAAWVSVLASAIWPLQAVVVAWVLGMLLEGQMVSPYSAAAIFAGLGAFRAALGWLVDRETQKAAEGVIQDIRHKIVEKEAVRASSNRFGGAGAIAALAHDKIDLLKPYIMRYAPARTRVMVLPFILIGIAASQSWVVAIIFLISGPLIPVFMALVGMAAKEASERQLQRIGTLNDLLVERLSALVDIRLLGARDQVMDGFADETRDLRERSMAVLRVAFLSSTVLELFAAIGVAMVAVYVGFSLLGVLNFGTWGEPLSPMRGIFLLLIAPEFYQPLRDLSAAWHDKASAEAVAQELDAWEAVDTEDMLGTGAVAVARSGDAGISLQGCVLNNQRLPDMVIAAGESVALMGPSGCGKTSCLRLIAGLSRPAQGRVEVAGQPLTDQNADAWRARLGWMPQTPHFLSGSLRHALMFSKDHDPTEALEQAGIYDVVAGLPRGLDTRLGEAGGGLSGGEGRRLMLARALYKKPQILLADEPTADLDHDTADTVVRGLLAARAAGTALIVATHDADLARQMDRIIQIGGEQ
ncbi:thiol reductant ABC exporter subunit CydD [Rhodobacteraceae bacterium]|nr:thiol reductant ABC exporter subunit CydD [Paracoccaceae bacterium]